jgi:hypothetical protein
LTKIKVCFLEEEERNKNPISGSAELFVLSTKAQPV